MRIHGGHIAGLVVIALSVFVLLAVLTQPEEADPIGRGSEEGLTRPPSATGSDVDANLLGADPSELDRILEGVGTLPPIGVSDEYAAKIEVQTTEFDVGLVPNDRVSFHPFKVKNHGKVPLKISSIKTTCPCTEGHIADGTIPPGGEANIEVRIDPNRIGGFESLKTLTIYSNDPNNGAVEVNVSARVAPEFEVVPNQVDFGEVAKGDTPSFLVMVRQLQKEPDLGVTELTPLDRMMADKPLDDLRMQLVVIPEEEWLDPTKREYGVRVTLSPLLPPGPFTRSFSVITNIPRMQGLLYKVDVRGEVKAPYSVTPVFPERLVVRLGDDAPTVLTVRGGDGIQIVEPEFDAGKFAVSIREESEPEAAYLEVRTAPDAPAGRIEAELRYQVAVAGERYPERVGVVRTFGGGVVPSNR